MFFKQILTTLLKCTSTQKLVEIYNIKLYSCSYLWSPAEWHPNVLTTTPVPALHHASSKLDFVTQKVESSINPQAVAGFCFSFNFYEQCIFKNPFFPHHCILNSTLIISPSLMEEIWLLWMLDFIRQFSRSQVALVYWNSLLVMLCASI